MNDNIINPLTGLWALGFGALLLQPNWPVALTLCVFAIVILEVFKNTSGNKSNNEDLERLDNSIKVLTYKVNQIDEIKSNLSQLNLASGFKKLGQQD